MSPAETRAREVIESLRPYVQSEGGDVFVDRLDGDVLYIRFEARDDGSITSLAMLRMGIERRICEDVPDILAVEIA